MVAAVKIAYRDGNIIVSAELPGLTEKDVKVEINEDLLTIQGERKVEQEETEGGIRRTERKIWRVLSRHSSAGGSRYRTRTRGVSEWSVARNSCR